MAQSNPAGGGGQATASAPGGYYLPAFAANMGMDILNASQQTAPQQQQNHPQRQQPEQYTNYDAYYQSSAYSDQGLSGDMSQLVRQGHEQSHQQDQTTFEQDLGAALGIDTSDSGSPNRQVSLENSQENGHNIWAQFLESQQDSILAWDQDQHLQPTSEVQQPASTARQSNGGHGQYQYSNGDNSSSIAGYSQMNNQYGIYGEPYGHPHTALPYQQTPIPPPPHLQQQQQVQQSSQPQQYQFVSQQRPRSHAMYGHHPPHHSTLDQPYSPMPPRQHTAQQQPPPRQPQMQSSMASQMQSPIQQSMHSRIEEPEQQSIPSTPVISTANANGSGGFYDSQAQQPSLKQEAMEQQPHITLMHNLQRTPTVSPSFLPPQTTPTQKQLQQPVHPHSQASVPFQHQEYVKPPLPPHLQPQQKEQQQLQQTPPNAVPLSQPKSQAKAKRQPSQQLTPVLQNKFVVPATNPSSSLAFEPSRKRARNSSTTVTNAVAPDLNISTAAATSMLSTQGINSASNAASPTLSALKVQRREDKDVTSTKGKWKASPVISIVPESTRLSTQTGFLSPINSQIAGAPSKSPLGTVHESILSSQITSQPAVNNPVPGHGSGANQITSAPSIVRPDDSSQVVRNHINATPGLPNSQQFLQPPNLPDSGIGTMKPVASTPILKVERNDEAPRLPKLSDLDRDELLATMLAESEYVDPPMTRSEYIASLGVIPELVTTVPYNRLEYFAKSSIPSDISSEVYAREGIEAAFASRLPPFALHPLEYALLKNDINHLHVTTYLNIRNGILRLWRMNHHVSVTRAEAAGCSRDPRFFGLAEAAFELLVRHGYINFGVVDIPRCRNNFPYMLPIPSVRRPRLRIVVIGAGMAGLGCARQLDGLFKQYDDFLSGYETPPEIVILEGRQRIGGRVYSAPLRNDGDQNSGSQKVDLGGQIITGFGNGNPLAVIVRKQLGLPCHELQDAGALYDEVVGGAVSASLDRRAEGLFNDMLDRVAAYRAPVVPPHTVEGDVSLVTSGKDPTGDGGRTIARMEANAVDLPPLEPTVEVGSYPLKTVGRPYTAKTTKTSLDLKLEDLGFVVSKNRNEHDLPPFTTTPVPPQAPTLGATLDRQLGIVRQLADLTVQDLRLINWHYANLEYANATSVHNLSLGSWDQDDGNEFSGKHAMLENGGYMLVPRALYLFPTRLDVRFKSSVKIVAYEASKEAGRKKFTVTMHSGESISADRVICTVPLGVLKADTISFQPELPEKKKESIQNLGFGVLNKVVLVYDMCFWDPDKDIVGVARDNNGSADRMNQESYRDVRGRFYMFWNCTKVVGKHCLVALMAGQAAVDTSRHPDEVLIRDATYVLSRMYPSVAIPHPTETIITRWHQDPFSRGSYSFVGPNATGEDYDTLAAPTCDDNLFFAGEATSRTHPATVHGAYLSGLRAAEEVFRTVVGNITLASPLVKPRLRPNVPLQTETVTFPPPPKSAYVGEVPPVPQPVRLPHIPLGEFEMMPVDEGIVPIKRRAKPGPKPKAKSSTPVPLAVASTTTSQSQVQPFSFNIISPNGYFPTKNSTAGAIDPHLHLLRAQQLRDQRLAAHARECEAAISKALGSAVPPKPEKAHLNPFILFQKVNWEQCRVMAEQQRRLATGDANAKPTVADIRAILSQKWRNSSDEEKKPVIEETNRNRVENERRFAEYKLRLVEYEEKVKLYRENWFKEHESAPTKEETSELELASTVA
ncbi:flavin-containing amine oxidoreductase-domain containing protein [Lipomyces tetrasporus]|uniref:Flavin-containing amine oxidoreductase-domain containing protein n=1 Tax=Lipomyces tetrasporus TaxID=54092 RepID=A0AAD7VV04_9ASCO|nr:flavin-containing amine oxidoreductase-domain containing protein [Lipomyces tetrasporus]KAJ8102444.1 flavin-containing amine oxidoreductase-domain containing protein [Lipomyces tetrasporus]